MGKEVVLRSMFYLESFQMIGNGESKFLSFGSSLNYRSVYFIHLIKSCFVEDVLFYSKNEVMAFPKIEIKWDLVSDVHVYITFDTVIWFWQYVMFSCFQLDSFELQETVCIAKCGATFSFLMLAIQTFFPYAGNRWINLWNWESSYFIRSARALIV